MKDKILALLVAKFAGVRKDGLAQLATAMSIQAADETEATALVEKISADKVESFVKDWRKDVDKEVSEGNKTFEANMKKKFDLVEKKDPDPGKDADSNKKPDQTETPAWAKALIEQNQKLAERFNSFEGQKINETRLQQIESKFKDVPESYKAQRLADAKMLIGNMDETAFSEYSTRLETDITAFNQELANKGLSGQAKPNFGAKDTNGVSAATAAFIASKAEEGKTLTGKEV